MLDLTKWVQKITLSHWPVGSIYMSVDSTDPGDIIGGTWQQIENRFLLAAGSSYTAGATGGEATHVLTPAETATKNHSHTFAANFYIRHGQSSGTDTVAAGTNTTVTDKAYSSTWANGYATATYSHKPDRLNISGTTGGNPANANGSAHNNMPPYLVVYIWKRTA